MTLLLGLVTRRISQGWPTASVGSAVKDTGFSHRRVCARDRRLLDRIPLPARTRSLVLRYREPALSKISAQIRSAF